MLSKMSLFLLHKMYLNQPHVVSQYFALASIAQKTSNSIEKHDFNDFDLNDLIFLMPRLEIQRFRSATKKVL